jgi:hypothetical protein
MPDPLIILIVYRYSFLLAEGWVKDLPRHACRPMQRLKSKLQINAIFYHACSSRCSNNTNSSTLPGWSDTSFDRINDNISYSGIIILL